MSIVFPPIGISLTPTLPVTLFSYYTSGLTAGKIFRTKKIKPGFIILLSQPYSSLKKEKPRSDRGKKAALAGGAAVPAAGIQNPESRMLTAFPKARLLLLGRTIF
ncbi:MAG: hypothetical protein ACOY40_14075 [Bacillota bacterium]